MQDNARYWAAGHVTGGAADALAKPKLGPITALSGLQLQTVRRGAKTMQLAHNG